MPKRQGVILLIVAGLILTYLEISFLELNINFASWSVACRVVYAYTFGIAAIVVFVNIFRKW